MVAANARTAMERKGRGCIIEAPWGQAAYKASPAPQTSPTTRSKLRYGGNNT
jgi:hypothetical protein